MWYSYAICCCTTIILSNIDTLEPYGDDCERWESNAVIEKEAAVRLELYYITGLNWYGILSFVEVF